MRDERECPSFRPRIRTFLALLPWILSVGCWIFFCARFRRSGVPSVLETTACNPVVPYVRCSSNSLRKLSPHPVPMTPATPQTASHGGAGSEPLTINFAGPPEYCAGRCYSHGAGTDYGEYFHGGLWVKSKAEEKGAQRMGDATNGALIRKSQLVAGFMAYGFACGNRFFGGFARCALTRVAVFDGGG